MPTDDAEYIGSKTGNYYRGVIFTIELPIIFIIAINTANHSPPPNYFSSEQVGTLSNAPPLNAAENRSVLAVIGKILTSLCYLDILPKTNYIHHTPNSRFSHTAITGSGMTT